MKTTLDLALIRWAVVCESWNNLGGTFPQIGPFLAGWYHRDMELPLPDNLGTFQDSFRCGYREADVQIEIMSRP